MLAGYQMAININHGFQTAIRIVTVRLREFAEVAGLYVRFLYRFEIVQAYQISKPCKNSEPELCLRDSVTFLAFSNGVQAE